jgi:DNA polymerase I-like protein with 3'-5' exonuclease and polymerase domains
MHTKEPYYKDDGKLWSKPWRDLHTFWIYNAKDSATCMELARVLMPLLDKDGFRKAYDDTIAMFPVLCYMMLRGMKVDGVRLEETKIDISEAIADKTTELEQVADYVFNINSPKQCVEYFYEHKNIKPYTNRKTGNPTTDDKALSRIYRRFQMPEAKLVQEIRALKKLRSTYLEVGIDEDSRIRSSYNPRGTKFGRLSSSQTIFGTGMNMQNLDSRFKGFLIAD